MNDKQEVIKVTRASKKVWHSKSVCETCGTEAKIAEPDEYTSHRVDCPVCGGRMYGHKYVYKLPEGDWLDKLPAIIFCGILAALVLGIVIDTAGQISGGQ